jgi:hypothetical protein
MLAKYDAMPSSSARFAALSVDQLLPVSTSSHQMYEPGLLTPRMFASSYALEYPYMYEQAAPKDPRVHWP